MVSVMKMESSEVDLEKKVETNVSDEFYLSEFDDFVKKSGKVEVKVKEARVLGGKSKEMKKGIGNTGVERLSMKEGDLAKISSSGGAGVSDFDSAYAMVDEGAATRMSEAFGLEAEKALSYGFEPGDMVWGKVKSHPWWPGHVFSEAFATPSVRRSKREGHVLVAFFGDSSYGWFDPAELIPFEPHYAEKSKQSTSRTFLKAVDEAMDEASRRCALGLTCRCRNPYNFRPTSVRSYFAVDVAGYEPGAVYSVMQTKKARERFQAIDALQFVQQLALRPKSFDRRNMDSMKSRAMILAYRKTTFEEFDETYAEAFGMQPVRPSEDQLDKIAKLPIRAPLSGPMVIAEALGERKKSTKVKEQLKKDKYLFKRRDEANESRSNHASQGKEGITVSPAYKEGVPATAPGDYVFQKRTSGLSTNIDAEQDKIDTITKGDTLVRGVHGEGADTVDRKFVAGNLNLVDAQVDMSAVGLPSVGSSVDSTSVGVDLLGEKSKGQPDLTGIVHSSSDNLQPQAMVDSEGESSNFNRKLEVVEPHNQRFSTAIDEPNQVLEGTSYREKLSPVATPQFHIDAQSPGMVPPASVDGSVKKTKVRKRPAVDSDGTFLEKKKKKKKESQFETSSEHSHKRFKISTEEELVRKSAGKSIGIGLPPSEKSQFDLQRRDSVSSSTCISSDSALSLENIDLGNIEVELPQVVNDMLALALDPFYGVDRNSAAVVRHVLLRFRSLVYQKSLVLSPASEAEALESSAGKPPTSAGGVEIPSGEDMRVARKHPRHLPRSDDPTIAGRKRGLSDRQEEKSAKRLKKVNDVKVLTAERKAGSQKITEVQREQKDANISAPARVFKLDSAKRPESPARVAVPAMVVLKFPQETSLPSPAELKARFGRFGPLDHSAMRVFYKSNTCRVVFIHKVHAQAAYNHAVRNRNFFGHAKVNYQLKDVGGQALPEPESAKWQANGASDEFPQFRPIGGSDSILGQRPMTPIQRSRQPIPNSQLKSILKKPSSDEVGSSVSFSREVPRVKFMLGGDENNRGEQLMGSNSKDPNNTGTSADGGASSVAMDVNSKNFQKVIPQTLPHLLPFPPPHRAHDVDETRSVGHQIKVEPINFKNYFNTTPATITSASTSSNNKKMDISHQMLSLLMKCNDVVTDVKGSLGYVPYRPL